MSAPLGPIALLAWWARSLGAWARRKVPGRTVPTIIAATGAVYGDLLILHSFGGPTEAPPGWDVVLDNGGMLVVTKTVRRPSDLTLPTLPGIASSSFAARGARLAPEGADDSTSTIAIWTPE